MIAFRRIRDGWFLHWKGDPKTGLIVSKDYSQMRLIRKTGIHGTYIDQQYIKIALECLLARRGHVSLHAACISMNGEAIAFTGKSGMGKSVRAEAWQNAFGASLISGDRPLVRIGQNPEVYGVPWDGKESCYRNVHYPLRAICEVRRSGYTYARDLSFRQRRALLMQQCFIPMWDTETAAIQIMNIYQLASQTNIIRAFCGPTAKDAARLKEIMDRKEVLEEKKDMKAKAGFILREIAGEYMLFPVDDQINQFNGAILMNQISSFVWEKLQHPVSKDDLLIAIADEYDVEEEKAAADLDELLQKMKKYGMIEEEV